MNQGQATIEYLGLVLAGLVVACLLLRAATPVEHLALAMVHAIVPERHPARLRQRHVAHHRAPHRQKPACTCIYGSTWPEIRRLTQEPPSSFSATGGFTE